MPTRPPTHGRDLRRRDEKSRATAAERGYGSRWQRYREIYLQQHPACVKCQAAGRAMRSQEREVDHIIPHRGDQKLFWDPDNHQTLCKPCHSEKTVTTDGGFGR